MNKGLKITNAQSSIPPVANNAPSEEFQRIANEAAERMAQYKERAGSLGLKLKGLIESKILPENKTLLLKDFEGEVLVGLIRLANDLNNDQDQQDEGMGSITLSQLIMKMLLLQRDHINRLEFRIEQLEKQQTT